MGTPALADGSIEWWKFGLWGLAGGAATIAMDFWVIMRERDGRIPVKYRRLGFWLGEICRILVGGVLAVALGGAQQLTVPIGAFAVGIAAPLIMTRLREYGSRDDSPPGGSE